MGKRLDQQNGRWRKQLTADEVYRQRGAVADDVVVDSPAIGMVYRRTGQATANDDHAITMITKLSSEQTRGAICLFDATMSPESGVLTRTLQEDQTFCILDGTVRFVVNDRLVLAESGDCLFIPRGTPFRWSNGASTPARMLIAATPVRRQLAVPEARAR
jgi:mannose-6-phosphate isomerase-like protein (cupin superfamily)